MNTLSKSGGTGNAAPLLGPARRALAEEEAKGTKGAAFMAHLRRAAEAEKIRAAEAQAALAADTAVPQPAIPVTARAKPKPQPADAKPTHARRGEANPEHAWASSLYKTVIDEEPNVANLSLVLNMAIQFRGAFGYNELLCSEMMMSRPPRPMEDGDVVQVQSWLQAQGFKKAAKGTVHDAVDQVCRSHPYHPIRQYLAELTWDGVPRLDTWLSRYLGAERNDYTARVGRMFLTSMVARVERPGCKADYMPVLEGPQGTGKSTACRILAGAWFSDSLPHDLSDKDASQHLPGKWLIEIGEMASFSRADTARLKQFITTQSERYRPSYGRKEVTQDRQCIFVGTTNQETYLRDETGARRFWPVKTGNIDTDALTADRDQLFAEAVAAFKAGEHWWPDRAFEKEHMEKQQRARYETDAWESLIIDALDGKTETTIAGVATSLNIPARDLDQTRQKRIAAVLKWAGWERKHTAHGKVWRRDDLLGIAAAGDAAKGVNDIPV